MNIQLLISNWVLIMCPGVLRVDKEVSPTVSGLCLVSFGKSFLADVLKLTSEHSVLNITSHKFFFAVFLCDM